MIILLRGGGAFWPRTMGLYHEQPHHEVLTIVDIKRIVSEDAWDVERSRKLEKARSAPGELP